MLGLTYSSTLFKGGLQRWTLWETRLQDIAEEELDDRTRTAAVSAYEDMEAARGRSHQ